MDEAFRNTGAFLMGRRMFDGGERPWGDDPPFHAPVFVVTHEARDDLVKDGGTTFLFVTSGVEDAVRQARAAAGEQDVSVTGGASIIQQLIEARLLDEVQVHVVPVLLGDGRRLFDGLVTGQVELECTRAIQSPSVTHLRYRVVK